MTVRPPRIDTLEAGADVTDYRRLLIELRRERKRKGMSCEELDAVTGLPDRYTSKIENWGGAGPGRGLGDVSLPLMLQALGLRLILVRDEAGKRKRRKRAA